jgi:hypothetical protein
VLQKLLLPVACLIISISLLAQPSGHRDPIPAKLLPISFTGIKGNIIEVETGAPLPARIVITDDSGRVFNSYYKHLPGFFTEEDGSFSAPLKPGNYSINVFHGINYTSEKLSFAIKADTGFQAEIYLKSWSPLQKQGWVCGDGHDHLYTEKQSDTAMLRTLRKICLAQGIDFVCAAQGWAGYNDSSWRDGYRAFSDGRFTISYGSEMPKYRTGHTWWFGQTSTRNYFWSTMDTVYENQYFQSPQGTTWNFSQLPFPFIPDVEVVQRFKTADASLAIMAHPTSWWWQKRGDVEKHVTNVAANLPFSLLAGKIWDGLVVMGYDHDHYFYQNLWFHVLNEGYRFPAIAELDGGYEKEDNKFYGSMRTYYQLTGKFSIDQLATAVRNGRTFVSSGPIILADVDKKYQFGDIVTANGTKHVLHIQAFASGDRDDYLSYVLIIRNGKPFKLWDLRDKKSREFTTSFPIAEKSKAWYVIKVYGKQAPQNPEQLDVLEVCSKGSKEKSTDQPKPQNDVAISSPFYFWPTGVKDPLPLKSAIHLTVRPNQGLLPKNLRVDVLVNGALIKTIQLKSGKASFSMPVNGILKIRADGFHPIYRTLYLDYLPHLALLEELATGNWMKKYKSTRKFNPGEVPWEAFQFEKTKEVLSKVNWTIDLNRNERDSIWEKFNQLFETDVAKKKQP